TTVKAATSAVVGNDKVHRLFDHAMRTGTPFVYFGECGGGRIPDILGGTGFTQVTGYYALARRRRMIPLALAIVGDSFGASSLMAGLSDLAIQVRGTCLAVTSPSVIEVATGEVIEPEQLGGAAVHAERTGLVDIVVDTEAEAVECIRKFLSYLPSSAELPPPRSPRVAVEPDPTILDVVPRSRRSGYDVSNVIRCVADPDSWFEIGTRFGRSVVSGLARIGGHAVGLIASQPSFQAGSLTPDACDKASRLMCLCDAYSLPIVMLQDTPGFLVGSRVEHDRLIAKAMLMQEAFALAEVPKITVLLRKGYGMGYYNMGGNDVGGDLLYAWAGSEIGFMDPLAGANVVHAAELAKLPDDDRRARRLELARELAESTSVLGPAGIMKVDEVIDPIDTRRVLVGALDRFATRPFRSGSTRPLASWPTSW
ncbi:MAG: carboxyl transferase domain-containing protein, partial [Ilumatobacteraceae bacterium]